MKEKEEFRKERWRRRKNLERKDEGEGRIEKVKMEEKEELRKER